MSDHTFLGLKILHWLSVICRIKSHLLSKIYTALQDLALTATFRSLCCHSYLVLCISKALAFPSHPCHLPSPVSVQHVPLGFRAVNLGHEFSSACVAPLVLLRHHLGRPWLSISSSRMPLYSSGLLPVLPEPPGHVSLGPSSIIMNYGYIHVSYTKSFRYRTETC